MTNARAGFGAIGPSHVDPRSGEILDADIGFESLSSRSIRALRSQILASRAAVDWPALMQSGIEERGIDAWHAAAPHDPLLCTYADQAAEQLGYALDVLEARGELDPGSPEAQQFVLDYLTDTTMHEVGHTLGLRHNFRASRVYTERSWPTRSSRAQNGLAGSVMEYAPINLASAAARARGSAVPASRSGPTTTGRSSTPTSRSTRIDESAPSWSASPRRSAEPQLAYGTDEDNFLGIDPESLHFDLGSDVLALRQEAHRHRARPAAAGRRRRELQAQRGLLRAAPLGQLRAARRRRVPRASWRARSAACARCATSPAAGATRWCRCRRPRSARRSKCWRAACSRPTASWCRRRCSAAWRPTSRSAPMRCSTATGRWRPTSRVSTSVLDMQRALLSQLMSDSVARAHPRQRAEGAPTAPTRSALSELYGRLNRRDLERARRQAATSRRCGASCSASTSTAWPPCCCARAR